MRKVADRRAVRDLTLPSFPMWWRLAALVAVYFVAGKLGLELAFEHASATAVWPPTGIALAAMLLYGYRVWPAIFVGAFLVNATTAGSIWTSLGIAAGNTLEGLLGVWLVRRWANGPDAFARAHDIFVFAAVAGLVSTTVSATIGATSLAVAGYADWSRLGAIWLTWWLGDAAGALVVTPVLVLWGTSWRVRFSRTEALEIALGLGAVVLAGSIVFGGVRLAGSNDPIEFLCIPPLVFVAFRFGQREAATAVALLAGIAIKGTLGGYGPFVRSSENESLLLLQAFMGTLATVMLPIAAVVRAYARSERELARTAAIVVFSDDAIIGKTLDGVITTWNAGAARLYGYEAGEVIGRSISTIVPPEVGEDVSEILAEVKQGRPVDNYETLRVAKDGRRVHVSVTVSAVRDPDGRIVGASSIARDVTHRKEIEAATRERDTLRSLASLAAAAAHEINNPLAVVMGQTQMLAGEVAASGRARTTEILEAVARINTIVVRMTHLTRIEMLRGSPVLPEMLDIRKSSEPDISGGSDAAVAALALGSRSLIVVARDQRARCEHLEEMFAAESVEVILDRRVGERRRREVTPEIERRVQQRRRNDITLDLQLRGWAMVKR